MTPNNAARCRLGLWVLGLAGLICALQPMTWAVAQEMPSRQVTLFGILATPNSANVDKELKGVEPQLRQLLPGYRGGFKLLESQSKRLLTGQMLTCRRLNGFVAQVSLMNPLDVNGKVQLRFALGTRNQPPQSPNDDSGVEFAGATIVSTPPNQLSFFDKPLADGSRLIIGMGAR